MQTPTLFLALIAGLLSFLSPCVLPLVPAYIGYLSGTAARSPKMGMRTARTEDRPGTSASAMHLTATMGPRASAATATTMVRVSSSERLAVMGHAALFVLGFTLVFVIVIGGLAGAFSDLLRYNKSLVQHVMGVLLVVFGLHMIGAINIPFLNYTRRLGDTYRRPMDAHSKGSMSYFRSLLIGIGFGAGWTPCIGPTLGAIFTLALNGKEGEAFPLFLAYSLGLGIPFMLTALAMGQISAGLKKLTRRMYSLKLGRWTVIDQVNIVSLVSGALIIVMGLLVFTNALTILNRFFPTFGI